ncbi:MAG: GntR family transcriptional regulator [Bacteroidales bacterium]|jgi:DNA-binding transcriptional regulator YhcF (GntR family)|nr:GntR family transcriptional regulator [Bacteroidales bacterium]MBR6278231.1 GntR family transcriptional regulator [Bacteroidales bacterium]
MTVDFFKNIINSGSQELKYKQIIEAVTQAVQDGSLAQGEILPSVNEMSKGCVLSRDTVYKAYSYLKKHGLIESVPNRGYFVSKPECKVFMLLDTFKAYKEVLYHSFRKSLSSDIPIDIRFHHYNVNVFENSVKESLGHYSKYVIMNFDNPKIEKIISRIPKEKLLLIDWNIHSRAGVSRIWQDFGQGVYDALAENISRVKKYNKFVLLYPEFTDHPKETIEYFRKFCADYEINSQILFSLQQFDIKAGELYLLVSDRTLAFFLEQCQEKGLTPGKNVGVISYNETPMKKYVSGGITVLSTDFQMMGQRAAEFVLGHNTEITDIKIPTKILLRNSL